MKSTVAMSQFQLTGANRFLNKNNRSSPLKIMVVFLFSFLIPFVAGASAREGQNAPPPLVEVETVSARDINPPSEYVGHVEPIQSVDIRARVEGFLEKVNYSEGDYIHSGDLLYQIEKAPYQAQVDVDRALVAQAEAEFSLANQNLKRFQSALPESIPAIDLDEAIASELRTKARLNEARADLTRSLLDLSYTTIYAPINGRVGRTAYTQGNLVGPASLPLARIVQMDPIRVVFSISENNLSEIQMAMEDMNLGGQKNYALIARLRFSDGTMFQREGRIDFVNNEMDMATGTIAVWAEFGNPEGRLIPGQYVNVLLTLNEPKMRPVVPQTAIQQDHDGAYVFTVDNDSRVVVRRVETGPVIDDVWVIESGLSEGEKVIIKGIQKVQPGMIVSTTVGDNGQGR
jgi:membrane fusion protein (multidrug efflux system)